MLNNPKTNVGPNVDDADDFTIGISNDGTKRIIRHDPSGQEMAFGPDGFEAAKSHVGEVSVNDTATDPTADGELTRNGSDVKVHSGGGERSIV